MAKTKLEPAPMMVQAPARKTASDYLREAADHIDQRAAVRDLPEGERSMARTVAAFNILTGHQITETEGWMFMSVLKLARASAGETNLDDFIDQAAYGALAAESAQ